MSARDESRRIIEMWRRWRESNGKVVTKNTIKSYRSTITAYLEWMQQMRYSISSMDREKWLEYCDYIAEHGGSNAYKRHKLRSVVTILHWLFDVDALKEFNTEKTRPVRTKISKMDSPLPLIPVYKDIQELRRTSMRLEDAMAFEVGISSGLRNDELRCVRMCDIDFSMKAKDITTNAHSEHCGGSVTVSTVVSSTKGGRDRKTYISPLAARLVRLYARVNGVNLNSQIPLILSEKRLEYAIRVANVNIDWVASRTKGRSSVKTATKADVGKDFLTLPKVMQKSYLARVKRESSANHIPAGRREGEWLTCHSLRYFFASAMLHRTYNGHRGSIEHVSKLLGHTSVSTTIAYIGTLVAVESDSDWKNVLNGTSSSWMNIILNKIDDPREWAGDSDREYKSRKRQPLTLS